MTGGCLSSNFHTPDVKMLGRTPVFEVLRAVQSFLKPSAGVWVTMTTGILTFFRFFGVCALAWGLAGCSPRHLIIQSVATELARQGGAAEELKESGSIKALL
jgi:hypothetical protein